MNEIGKKYPRIYSISTIGIRNHNNADFLIHPLRTDFTGQSATGKSLIGADLPQLILTAGRFYKSATKPKGDVSRDYNSIPLSNKDFGYAFMNVELKEGKFIVIGVMIRRAPKQLHPFIIQKNIGIHSENNPKFIPLEKILRYKDFFLNDDILSIDSLKRHLDSQDIYLTSFYHNIPSYHKLLYKNKIIHLDLSMDENLQRQYAHTLQSLARGEDIDTSGSKFKRFLFHYDDEIAEKFKNQSKAIEDDHRKYEEDWKAQDTLSRKKDSMLKLLDYKRAKVEAFEVRLANETAYYLQQKHLKEEELKTATKEFFQTDLDIIAIQEKKVQIEIDRLDKEKNDKRNELKREQGVFDEADSEIKSLESDLKNTTLILPSLEKERDALKGEYEKNIQAENWLKVYNSTGAITNKFLLQSEITIQKEKLRALTEFLEKVNLVTAYEDSEYSKGIKSGIEYYKKIKEDIVLEIDTTKKLKEIVQKQNPNSFAGWALNEEIRLSELQEAVLFHFATLPVKFDKDNNFIPEPSKFIEALSKEVAKTDSGFIINLSGLHYHIPKRENYIFGNPKILKTEIEKIGKDFQIAISTLQSESDQIDNLEKLFTQFNYSQEHLTAYLNKDSLQTFFPDNTLNLTEQQFNEIIEIYNENLRVKDAEKIEERYLAKQALYADNLGRKNISEQNKRNQESIKLIAQNQIGRLTKEIKEKENRITFLQNTELIAIETKLIAWKSDLKNPIQFKQDEFLLYKQKYKNDKEENALTSALIELSRRSGVLEGELKSINLILPDLSIKYTKKKEEYEKYFKKNFYAALFIEEINADLLEKIKTNEIKAQEVYEICYNTVVENFKDHLQDNPKIKYNQYDLNTLILELIPHEIISNKENPEESLLSDIEDKLAKLHQQIRELNKEEAKKIHNTVRDLKRIVEQQTTFLDLIRALLKDFRLANYHKVLLSWNYSDSYNIKWIDALNRDIENLNFTDNLFGEKTKTNAHELLEITFKKYCSSKIDAKANEILNPFNYYDAKAIITDPNGSPSPGSSGQNYGMLALLCIAKLSIVEGRTHNIFDKIEPGIRILPIDEVAGLGENFDMLYEIAQKLDYQIFTMTIAANDLTFENGKQIYYEFIKNSDEKLFDYNEGVQACFSKDNLITDIETHFSDSIFNLDIAKNDSN